MKYLFALLISINAFAFRGAAVSANRGFNRNLTVNRNINVAPGGWHGYYAPPAHYYHPVATAAVVTGAAVVTAAAIGSIVHSVPSNCISTTVGGATYSQCGSTWYQPQYVGTTVQYIVVKPPI